MLLLKPDTWRTLFSDLSEPQYSITALRSTYFRHEVSHEYALRKLLINLPAMEHKPDFDFLVAGGGTAGCVMASRLSQAGFSVAVFEAGPEDYSDQVMSPLAAPMLLGSPLEYNYLSKEQPQYVPLDSFERAIDLTIPSLVLPIAVCQTLGAAYCPAPQVSTTLIGQNVTLLTMTLGVSDNSLLKHLRMFFASTFSSA